MYIDDNLYSTILKLMPIVCVDVLIQYNDSILLVKRNNEPAKNEWWFLGGRLHKGETLENCAIRKCKEEVGLKCIPIQIINTESTQFNTGPNGIPVHSVNIVYWMQSHDNEVELDSTSSYYKWWPEKELFIVPLHSYINDSIDKYLDWNFSY